MTEVQKAELALQQAKKQEKLKYRLEELDKLKVLYENKCVASHTFQRRTKSSYMGAKYYEKFYLEADEIWVIEWSIYLSKNDSFYKPSKNCISYSRHIFKRQLTGINDKNAFYNLGSHSFFNKEISYEKFMQLWECAEECNIILNDVFSNKIPEIKTEHITIGDHSAEEVLESCIKTIGIELIDFKNYPEVHRVLEYKTLPMFDRNRWLPKIYAKSILEWEIKRIQEDMNSVFSTLRGRAYNQNQIDIIQKFINNNL